MQCHLQSYYGNSCTGNQNKLLYPLRDLHAASHLIVFQSLLIHLQHQSWVINTGTSQSRAPRRGTEGQSCVSSGRQLQQPKEKPAKAPASTLIFFYLSQRGAQDLDLEI